MDLIEQWKIPLNWKWAQISELGKIVAGGTPSTKESSYWGDEINWITPADLSGYNDKFISKGAKSISKRGLEKSSAQLMPSGSIHFSSRAPIGYVVISKEEISTNQGFKSLVPANEIFNEYVYYYFKIAKQLAEKYASGTTFKEISKKAFSLLPIPIAPHSEQRAIVSKIEQLFSDLDNGIENFKKAQEQLKIYRQAVLKNAFEGNLTKEWRKSHKSEIESASVFLERIIKDGRGNELTQQVNLKTNCEKTWKLKYKESVVPENIQIPLNWSWINLEVVCNAIDPQPSHRTPPKVENGIPYLGMGDIDNGIINFVKARKVSPTVLEEHRKRYQLRIGDFIIGKIGTIGKPVKLIQPFNYTLSANVVLIQPKIECLNPRFAFAYMSSPLIEELLQKDSRATTQAAFGIQKVRTLPIPFTSLEEQALIANEIETRLSICDKMEETITESLQKAESLRQSILKKAFEGKLLNEKELEAVRNAPDWEPAEKLLDRIKAEKTNTEANKKGKK